MYYALNSKNETVYIEQSTKNEEYRCPVCDGLLIRKYGSQKAHHFAHKASICDSWYHDNKGEWHKEMQSHFPPEQCEVRIDGENGVFHIADVFIEGKVKNYVIEFQHSPISAEEFEERTIYYSTHRCKVSETGKPIVNKVIWVFDYRKKRLFIDTFPKQTEPQFEPASENEMCQSLIKNLDKECPDGMTQRFQGVNNEMDARIRWKRPLKLFRKIERFNNVWVILDVSQRRYVDWKTYYYLSGYLRYSENNYSKQEHLKYVSELSYDPDADDKLADFMVFASYGTYTGSRFHNYFLSRSPERFFGRCMTHEDFLELVKGF